MDAKTLNDALVSLFPTPCQDGEPLAKDAVLQLLYQLQRDGVRSRSVVESLANPNLDPQTHAIISILDEQLTTSISDVELPSDVAEKIRSIAIVAMRLAIADGILAVTKSPIVPILDSLLYLCLGWVDVKGKSKELLEARLSDALTGVHVLTRQLKTDKEQRSARNYLLELVENDIVGFVSNERDRVKKLEQRLIEAESGQLTADRSRRVATRLLNSKMHGKQLPADIIGFLQGVWFDSLQLIATRDGTGSECWQQVSALTETLIKTVQPPESSSSPFDAALKAAATDIELEGDENGKPNPGLVADQQLYRIIEQLPDELKQFLVSIEHDEDAIAKALVSIEAIHIDILKGEAPEISEFEPLADEWGDPVTPTRVSEALMTSVARLSTGTWFTVTQDDGTAKQIKLTLKADESELLVFTNRNGASVLQVSFEDFAYLLSTDKAKAISAPGELLKQLKFRLMATLKQKAKEDKAVEQQVKRIAAEKRKVAMEKTQFVLVAVDKEKLAGGAKPEDLIDADSLLSAQHEKGWVFVDKSGLDLGDVGSEELAKLIRGDGSEEVCDQMPKDMSQFKASVEKIRKSPSLEIQAELDDE